MGNEISICLASLFVSRHVARATRLRQPPSSEGGLRRSSRFAGGAVLARRSFSEGGKRGAYHHRLGFANGVSHAASLRNRAVWVPACSPGRHRIDPSLAQIFPETSFCIRLAMSTRRR